jgi:hypothetical protein
MYLNIQDAIIKAFIIISNYYKFLKNFNWLYCTIRGVCRLNPIALKLDKV